MVTKFITLSPRNHQPYLHFRWCHPITGWTFLTISKSFYPALMAIGVRQSALENSNRSLRYSRKTRVATAFAAPTTLFVGKLKHELYAQHNLLIGILTKRHSYCSIERARRGFSAFSRPLQRNSTHANRCIRFEDTWNIACLRQSTMQGCTKIVVKCLNMHRFRNDIHSSLLNIYTNSFAAPYCWSKKLHTRVVSFGSGKFNFLLIVCFRPPNVGKGIKLGAVLVPLESHTNFTPNSCPLELFRYLEQFFFANE